MGFDFGDNKVFSVEAYIDTAGGSLPAIAAFDAKGNLIAGQQAIDVSLADWDTNSVQVISRVPIARIVFLGGPLIVDEVSFESAKPKILKGGKGDDKHLDGSKSDDFLFGAGGNDRIDGKSGNDTIEGGKANDKVKGGEGDDTLLAGPGKDSLSGGGGRDSFVLSVIDGVSKVKDFNPVFDTIVLARSEFFGLQQGNPAPVELVIGSVATDSSSRLIYDPATGSLAYDGDGTGPGALKAVAKLPAGLALSVEDFLVA